MGEIERMVQDSGQLDAATFSQRWNVHPGYMHGSDNGPAGLLSDDPRRDRLTLNGFFTCTGVAT
jgi:hypothetical protein